MNSSPVALLAAALTTLLSLAAPATAAQPFKSQGTASRPAARPAAANYNRPAAAQPKPQAQPAAKPAAPVAPADGTPAGDKPAPAMLVAPAPEDPVVAAAKQSEAAKKAVESQMKRAEAGSSGAQYDLGVRYLKGDGVEKDPSLARKWLSASAKQDNTSAQRKLAELDALEKAAPSDQPEKDSKPAKEAKPDKTDKEK